MFVFIMSISTRARFVGFFAVVLGGCTSSSASSPATDGGASTPLSDAEQSALAVTGMHDALLHDLDALHQATLDLQAAAPVTTGKGWGPTVDAAAITATKEAWKRARASYERIEGALAPLFPDIDASLDARYDDFLSTLAASGGDQNLFDDQGVTGLHAIERILYVDVTPPRVVDFEKVLPGYKAAAFPATEQEAAEFKNKLCAKAIADASALRDQWSPAHINIAIAFQGLVSLMNEQREKVTKASTNEEESRYSQRTMADIRDNLAGTKTVYAIFQPWITSKMDADASGDGKAIDAKTLAGFAELDTAYAAVQGDAIPQPPATWSAQDPSAADLMSPFGQLYSKVKAGVDPTADGSVVFEMNLTAAMLGFPLFTQ